MILQKKRWSARVFALLFSVTTLLFADERAIILKQDIPKLQTLYAVAAPKHFGPETTLSKSYYQLLNRYVRFARVDMHDWPRERGAKYHKADGSKEHSVRQNAAVALNLAVLSTLGPFDEKLAGATRMQVRADAIGIIRYLAVTHTNNFLPTGDGQMWGDHWQSAFWTAVAGQAAWLLWDDLPDDTKVMVARMVVHEADRFNERPPDSGENHDTKAEENAWNSQVIALAECMFPQHPNAKLWRERNIIYMINSFSTEADHADETIVDGRPVKAWISTTNIHSDFTLENHNRVHPDYLSTFTLNLRNALGYRMAGIKIPQATFHHVADIFSVLSHLTSVNGSFFYINGQDWWLHRHELPTFAGGLIGVLQQDPEAAAMERAGLNSTLKLHARFDDGRAFSKNEINYPNVEEELMARYAELYLAHRLFGDVPRPTPLRDFQKAQLGTRIFETGGFVTHRTKQKFASFTWVNGAMGLVFPSDDTWFTSPFERSLTGQIIVDGAKDTAPQLEAKTVSKLHIGHAEDGFAFVGKFSRCEGKVEQRLAMISLPDEPVIYIEQLIARSNVNVKEIDTGSFSVLNEDAKPIVNNERCVWTADRKTVMTGAIGKPAVTHVWKTTWANLDDRLGIFAAASGEMAFSENHSYATGRLQQLLSPNHLTNVGAKKAGETLSSSVTVLLPNARHTMKLKWHTEKFGNRGVAVKVGKWLVIANLGDVQLDGLTFGRNVTVAPLRVLVTRE